MALRMICRSIASKCTGPAAALPRATAGLGFQTSCNVLRQASSLVENRQVSASSSARLFSTSVSTRSALTDILQEELKYEDENYMPPEVRDLRTFSTVHLVSANVSTFCPSYLCLITARHYQEVADGPPEPWQLTETPGDTHMTLKRSHGNEKLQIDVMVNNQVSCTTSSHQILSNFRFMLPFHVAWVCGVSAC